jgi:hypothetical protein
MELASAMKKETLKTHPVQDSPLSLKKTVWLESLYITDKTFIVSGNNTKDG